MKVLFAASEAVPLVKTGGLADVAGALPAALRGLDVDARLVLPAYRGTLQAVREPRETGRMQVRGQEFVVLEATMPDSGVPLWLLDCPGLYAREGDPYHDALRHPFGDNAWRFGCYSEAAARLALGEASGGWRADLVHGNDWQAGLISAWLTRAAQRPRSVFTIHNLAHQGQFGRNEFDALGLPPEWWHPEAMEYYGGFSCLKAGIVFSDFVTTVSPTYAQEIQRPAEGMGLDDRLRRRGGTLRGILNGIDDGFWNPANDSLLARPYTAHTIRAGKQANREALQAEMGLEADAGALLIGMVGRLTYQKGTDVVIEALPRLLELPVQIAVLGSGDAWQQAAMTDAAVRWPGRVAMRIGYNEGLAHRIEAGADAFLMPSRFEPCGLNQMYSQRYGTPPLVRRTGGLADTVTDATPAMLAEGDATGVLFDHCDAGGVLYAVRRALELRAGERTWRGMQRAGMRRDFSWEKAAKEYLEIYTA